MQSVFVVTTQNVLIVITQNYNHNETLFFKMLQHGMLLFSIIVTLKETWSSKLQHGMLTHNNA